MPRLPKQIDTVIDYKALRMRQAWLEMSHAELIDVIRATGKSSCKQTFSRFMKGAEDMTVTTIKQHAASMGLRVRVSFELMEEGECKAS